AIAERVAKVHPDKFLVVDAYSAYAAPPVERKLHPNLVVRFAPLGYHAEDYRQESLRDWDGWARAAKRIYFRPNLMLLGRREGLMDKADSIKGEATAAVSPEAIAALRKELNQARKEAGSDAVVAKRVAFLELGLRWTEIEARAHAFLADPEKADKKAARKV